MRLATWLFATTLTLAIGCNKESSTEDDTDDTEDGSDTSDTSDTTPDLLEPVAVGFELDAIHLTGGTLTGYNIESEGTEYYLPPSITLTFTNAEYFSASTSEAQEGHYCIAFGSFLAEPAADDIPTYDDANLFVSYEGTFNIEYEDCTDRGITAGDWGADAAELLEKFNGMRIGIGLGPVTEYLLEPFDETDPDTAEYLATYGKAMMAEYIAINTKDNGFKGDDWTLAYLFEWDASTESLKADAEGLLIPVDISGLSGDDALPEGYLRSSAFWYEDFPHYSEASTIDFSKLKE